MLGLPDIRIQNPHTTHQNRHFRCRQGQELRLVDKQFLGRNRIFRLEVIAEPVGNRLKYREALDIGMFLRRIGPARCEGNLHGVSGLFRRLFDAGGTAEHDQIGERHRFAARLRRVERLLDAFERRNHLCEMRRLVHRPILLRSQTDTGTIGTAALVRTAERGSRRPSRRDEIGNR